MTSISYINAKRFGTAYREVDPAYRPHIGKMKMTSNSFAHELSKFIVCYQLNLAGIDFATEVTFRNGKRADIVDFNNDVIYEVLHTEKSENIDIKRKFYPAPITEIYTTDLNFVGCLTGLRNSFNKKLEGILWINGYFVKNVARNCRNLVI